MTRHPFRGTEVIEVPVRAIVRRRVQAAPAVADDEAPAIRMLDLGELDLGLRARYRFVPEDRLQDGDAVESCRVYKFAGQQSGQPMIGQPRIFLEFRQPFQADSVADLVQQVNLAQPGAVSVLSQLDMGPGRSPIYTLKVHGGHDPFRRAEHLRWLGDALLKYAVPDVLEYLPVRQHGQTAGWPGGVPWHLKDLQVPDARKLVGRVSRKPVIAVIDHGFCVCDDAGYEIHPRAAWTRYACNEEIQTVVDRQFMPANDHGTSCAATALGRPRGDWSGVAPAAALPIAVLSDWESQGTLTAAVHHAIGPLGKQKPGSRSRGADVIVCSLGLEAQSGNPVKIADDLKSALGSAATEGRGGLGIPIFWASTNSTHDICHDDFCSSPDVVAVSACGEDLRHRTGGFGAKLAYLAPGHNVVAPDTDGILRFHPGTSYAAPCAAGVAALVLAACPKLSRAEVLDVMERACVPVPGMAATLQGHGRLNALRAVQLARQMCGSPPKRGPKKLPKSPEAALKALRIKFEKAGDTIRVKTGIDLSYRDLEELPDLRTVHVEGMFRCDHNKLTSLEGAPSLVRGGFTCSHNQLTTLKGAPTEVHGGFSCEHNRLTTLEGAPTKFSGGLVCSQNPPLALPGLSRVPHTVGTLVSDHGSWPNWPELLKANLDVRQQVDEDAEQARLESQKAPCDIKMDTISPRKPKRPFRLPPR